MALLLKGAPAAAALNERTAAEAAALREAGIVPTLAVVRVGERPDDISYEKGAARRCEAVGVSASSVTLPEDVSQSVLVHLLDELSHNPLIHGILLLRPLPPHLDEEAARRAISPQKDVDGVTDASLAGVFTGLETGFAPCTAQAIVDILDYHRILLSGAHVVVIGRSLVVGRPAAMLLMAKGATVTICHGKTRNLSALTRQADILVVAAGQRGLIGTEHLAAGQVVVDVGIHLNESTGKLCGDVRFDEAEPLVSAITPVPGGVGAMTTSVLVSHVVEAAKRSSSRS